MTDAFPLEPAFVDVHHLPGLSAAGTGHRESLLSHAGHLVRRSPSDLRAPVLRVLMAQGLDDSEALCAALLDLACALGDKGLDLRSTLTARVGTTLTEPHRSMAWAVLRRAPTCVECEAVTGTLLSPAVPRGGIVGLVRPAQGDMPGKTGGIPPAVGASA